jgi:tetratricopeptide (TPR) repeat protein
MGLISLAVFLFASSLALLGTLQKGPLQDVLYKDSISVRGYYWRAALKMLQENLWFGVGPDNYGTYFRYYRDSGYPLKYGFDITSNNAHNVFLQFFATGGLFVGLSYLAIIIYIFLKCVANLKNLVGVDLINFAGLFSAWIAYLLQSLISIDNVGLAIWGWVLGGTLLGLTRRTELTIENSDRVVSIPESSNVKSIRQIFSVFMMIILILPLSFLIRGDTNMMVARSSYNPGLNIQNSALFVNIQNVLKIPFLDPYYKVILADILFRSGYTSDAKNLAQSLLKQYPDNVDIALALTYFNEATGDVLEAIKLRQEISRLDPWNAKNFLNMGQLYEYTKQTKEAQKSYLRIIQFAPNSELAKTAQEKLDKLVD